ncbi:hypothetical protein Hanom_Chr09g00813461 [Helianthus anomalus]
MLESDLEYATPSLLGVHDGTLAAIVQGRKLCSEQRGRKLCSETGVIGSDCSRLGVRSSATTSPRGDSSQGIRFLSFFLEAFTVLECKV